MDIDARSRRAGRVLLPVFLAVLWVVIVAESTGRLPPPPAAMSPEPPPQVELPRAPAAPTESGAQPNIDLDPSDSNVGPELEAQLAALPDGATAVFPSGTYRLEDHTVTVSGHRGLTIEGNGATFISRRPPTDRGRRVFEFVLQRDLTVRDFTYEGPNGEAGAPGSFDASREGAHGIALIGVRGALLEDLRIGAVHGDGINIRHHGQSGTRSRDIVVRRVHVFSAGRQGVAITDARDVLIERSRIEHATLKNLDIEPENGWKVTGVVFRYNQVGPSGSFAWGANSAGGTIRDISLHHNTMHSLAWGFPGRGGADRARFTIADNVGLNERRQIVSARGAIIDVETVLPLHHIDGLVVQRNEQPLAAGQSLVSFDGSREVRTDLS